MRLDGFFSDHTAEEKHKFLVRIKEKGVKNIEMESVGFGF
jgi:hypothetical protein